MVTSFPPFSSFYLDSVAFSSFSSLSFQFLFSVDYIRPLCVWEGLRRVPPLPPLSPAAAAAAAVSSLLCCHDNDDDDDDGLLQFQRPIQNRLLLSQ